MRYSLRSLAGFEGRLFFGVLHEKRTSTSHSAWSQGSCHHSPEVRQGPEAAMISPRAPEQNIRTGRPLSNSTHAGTWGRKRRNPLAGFAIREVEDFLSTGL